MIANVGRIWEAVSTDTSRLALTGVRFDAEAATLTATDTYIAAQVPCKVQEGDESGIIPAAALEEANGESLRIADGKAVLRMLDGERSWDLLAGPYPETIDKVLADLAGAPPSNALALNGGLLQRLTLALLGSTTTALTLHPTHPLRAIRVAMRNGQGAIMPARGAESTDEPLTLEDATFDASDDAILRGVQAAVAALQSKKGKARAAQAFRDAL